VSPRGMFLRVVGVKWVEFWATAMLWLRGLVGVMLGWVVVVVEGLSVARSVSSVVVVGSEAARTVAVLRDEGPETDGAWRSARVFSQGSDGWESWRGFGDARATAVGAWERRVGSIMRRSFIASMYVNLSI